MIIWKNIDVVKVVLGRRPIMAISTVLSVWGQEGNTSGLKVLICKMKNFKVTAKISSTPKVIDLCNHKDMGFCHTLVT